MHERHIIEGLIKQAAEEALEKGASRVARVTLEVGELSGLEESSLRLYFEEISKGTFIENAELVIEPVRAKLKCEKCGITFEREKGKFDCPECGAPAVRADASAGVRVKRIDTGS